MVAARNASHVHAAALYAWVVIMAFSCALPISAPSAACPSLQSTGSFVPLSGGVTPRERDILHFDLNLQYLEAEWFLWGALGHGLDAAAPQCASGPPPIGTRRANLDELTFNLVAQFGWQQVDHIIAISKTAGEMPRPLMDLSADVWATLMNEAFGCVLEPPFNPYESSLKFLIASYFIPYIGVTGYVGANPHLTTATAKRLIAGLEGVQSAQDAVIRAYLYARRGEVVSGYSYTVGQFTDALSGLRNRLGATGVVDEGLMVPICLGAHNATSQNVVAADSFSLSYSRSPRQILRIVYGTGNESCPDAFFPEGANGYIASRFLPRHPQSIILIDNNQQSRTVRGRRQQSTDKTEAQ